MGPESSSTAAHPRLASLMIEPTALRANGSVAVAAQVEPGGPQLGSERHVDLTVSTSTGDVEVLRAIPIICTLPSGEAYACRTFHIAMEPGHRVTELAARLPEIRGRFTWIGLGDEYGGIELVEGSSFADLHLAMIRARRWPAVRSVEVASIGIIASAAPATSVIRGSLAFTLAPPVTGDGVVQGAQGGTVTAAYAQPDGTPLTTTIPIP